MCALISFFLDQVMTIVQSCNMYDLDPTSFFKCLKVGGGRTLVVKKSFCLNSFCILKYFYKKAFLTKLEKGG